jgi:hypothetical protein
MTIDITKNTAAVIKSERVSSRRQLLNKRTKRTIDAKKEKFAMVSENPNRYGETVQTIKDKALKRIDACQ